MQNESLNQPSKQSKEQSGFEDDMTPKRCLHPEHQPPSHLFIPQGKVYRHVCPSCGFVMRIKPVEIIC